MNYPFMRPLILLAALFLAVGLACGMPTPTPETPAEVKPPEPAQKEEPEAAEPVEEPVTSGAVSSLQDVRGAVIQIEAEGTFVDPEFGEYISAGRGSGFIIDPSGLAVTNNHVVTGAALLKVWIGGDTTQTYNARVVAVSECSDLAVIDIDGDGFPYLDWYTDPIQVGLEVYSAGFPLGEPEFTLTKGIISKENTHGETSWASVDSVIMHDATINPGNSGGPLVTSDGKVVGVNYAVYASANQYFAIGREKGLPIIDRLKAGQDVDSLGVNGEAVMNDDGSITGIWVSSVASGSPADRAGITGGDIIMELEGHPLAWDGTMSDYCDIIRTHQQTDTMALQVLRFSTSEVLEGQLNGTALATTYVWDDTAGVSTGGDTSVGDDTTTSGDAPAFYVEDFDPDTTTIDNWYWFLNQGDENLFDIYTQDSKLVFDINGYDTYAYFVYDPWLYTDVRVDARAENRGKNNNNVSLICRGTEDGWYEFSIANNGLWWIFAYENGYTTIANGGSTAVNMGRGINEYTIMCYGNTLSLYINGVHTHTMEETKFVFREGQVGIGVSSIDVLPIIVEFDWVAISDSMQ